MQQREGLVNILCESGARCIVAKRVATTGAKHLQQLAHNLGERACVLTDGVEGVFVGTLG